MNMIYTCDSNKFMQWKQGGYYFIRTVLFYIKLFLMFPGINLLLLLCINIIVGSSRKLVKIEVCPNPSTPPGYGPELYTTATSCVQTCFT